jgi:chemotaxis response regulator CheB
MKAIIDSTGVAIAQDEASSLVYEMPKATGHTGAVDLIANVADMRAGIANAAEMIVARSLAIE